MEFLKKNWIWILVAVVIIVAVIIYFKRKTGTTGTLLGRVHIREGASTEAIKDIKTIIKLGVSSLKDLKQKAWKKGYSVYSQEEAMVAKMMPDPKTVIVSWIQPNCLMAPCPPMINVISVG